MRYEVVHRTEYHYDARVDTSCNEAHLLPRDLPTQRCVSSRLSVTPAPSTYHERLDFFGNRVASFAHDEPHRSLTVVAESVVDTAPAPPPAPLAGTPWELLRDRLRTDPACLDARPFVLDSPLVVVTPVLGRFAAGSFVPGRPFDDAVLDLSARVHADVAYAPGSTSLTTRASEALERREGVCQDFAHVFIGCLRAMGLPARYVSGYLETDPPPGEEKLVGSDASHAWVGVYVPGDGWFDVDPTNDLVPGERHVTLAWGRDYTDVTPLKGVLFSDATEHELAVSVDVVSR